MKRMMLTVVSVVAVLLAVSGVADAGIFTLAPSQATVLPDGQDGIDRLAVQFDLAGAGIGSSGRVVWAYLEWTLENAGEAEKEFRAHPVGASWTAAAAAQSLEAITYAADAVSWCPVTREREQVQGCLVRLDLKPQVVSWATGTTPNYGIVVASEGVQSLVLSNQLENVRLVVGYASGE